MREVTKQTRGLLRVTECNVKKKKKYSWQMNLQILSERACVYLCERVCDLCAWCVYRAPVASKLGGVQGAVVFSAIGPGARKAWECERAIS